MQGYARAVNRVLVIVLVVKLVMAGVQAYAAHSALSIALFADALNSFFDAGTTVVALIIVRLAIRPPDDDHPYGHRKFETVTALVISGILFITAFEIARLATGRLLGGSPPLNLTTFTFAVVIGSLVVNAFVMLLEMRAARSLGSEILGADAAHAKSDAVVNASVLAGFFLVTRGILWADAAVALLAAGIIAYEGVRILKSSLPVLTDRVVYEPRHVATLVRSVSGVRDVHDIRSRGHPSAASIAMHLVVEAEDVEGAHAVTERVEDLLRDRIGARDVLIHVEPHPDAR